MYLNFWLKTALYRLTPGGFGYYRRLRSLKDPDYCHDRDKHPVRAKHFADQGWKPSAENITYRDYGSYAEYTEHQKQKLREILKISGGFSNEVIAQYRLKFFRRFKHLQSFLLPSAVIVCLGARLGTEVEVLRDLGFVNAYGIDLNPGPGNRLVKEGDFMHLEEESSSVDFLYTNCIDHAFELDPFFREHARVLKPHGYVLYDLALDQEEAGPFESVKWARDEQVLSMMLRFFNKIVKVESEPHWKWILLQGKADSDERSHTDRPDRASG